MMHSTGRLLLVGPHLADIRSHQAAHCHADAALRDPAQLNCFCLGCGVCTFHARNMNHTIAQYSADRQLQLGLAVGDTASASGHLAF
jgi:hypothetical protein